MLSHYNHRHGSYLKAVRAPGKEVRALPDPTPGELDDPTYEPFGRYWVAERDVREALEGTESRGWLFGWRNSATSLDVRTMIPSVLPRTAVGHAFPIGFAKGAKTTAHLQAIWSSLVFDYVVRQKLSGSNVTYSAVKQIAIPTPERFSEPLLGLGVSLGSFVEPRVLEVAYTSNKMAPYAQDLGNAGEPFRWDPERRALITAELDAAMMHVYGLARNEVEHILDSFTVLRKYEERDYDEFRTRRLVLDFYDRMTTATETGIPYETPISPPPGEGPRHPPRSFSE